MDRPIGFLEYDPTTLARMEEIGVACFGRDYSKDLLTRNWLESDRRTRFIGIHEGDRLIAFNGFLAHPAMKDGESVLLFQSCHSATDPAYRGQGLFSRIIDHAKASLEGDYIVGFPNDQSGPIFTRRLGFETVDLRRIWLPTRFAHLLFDAQDFAEQARAPGYCSIDQRQAAAWKQKEHPGEIVTHEAEGNFFWGKVSTRSVGPLSLRVLKGGGADVGNPARLSQSLGSLGKALDVRMVQFICTHTAALTAGARLPLSGERTEPLIWYPLRPEGQAPLWDVYNGIKDIW